MSPVQNILNQIAQENINIKNVSTKTSPSERNELLQKVERKANELLQEAQTLEKSNLGQKSVEIEEAVSESMILKLKVDWIKNVDVDERHKIIKQLFSNKHISPENLINFYDDVGIPHDYDYAQAEVDEFYRRGSVQAFLEKWKNKEAVTLFEARLFLEYLALKILYEKTDPDYEDDLKVKQELEQYFKDTHQQEGFEEIEVAARQSAVISKINSPGDRFFHPHSQVDYQRLEDFLNQVVQDISNKIDTHPSIHGHPRELFTQNDMRILHEIRNNAPDNFGYNFRSLLSYNTDRAIQAVKDCIEKKLIILDGCFGDPILKVLTNDSEVQKILQNPQENRLTIVAAKEALMKIDLSAGREVELSLLANHPAVPEEYRNGLKNMLKINEIRGQFLDLTLFTHINARHNEKHRHPKAVIEGGGPTGLLMAITQYEAGAEVSLFEKRSTFYDRTQIVRLDPKWMTMLKYYLGEEYYKLFVDEGHRGALRGDGFGEIATVFLEEALQDRLTRLMSAIEGSHGIERMAAYEIKEVEAKVKGGFQTVAEYNAHYDPEVMMAIQEGKTPLAAPSQKIHRDVDILICAGGKNSPIRDQFLPSAVPVTEKQNYGVCSWMTTSVTGRGHELRPKPFPGQDPNALNAFQEFRGVIQLKKEFRKDYISALAQDFSANGILGSSVANEFKPMLNNFFENHPTVKAFIEPGPQQPYVQTRTFENVGLIYIGMEIPTEVAAIFAALQSELEQAMMGSDEARRKLLAENREMILKHLSQNWFQNVAKAYGMDKSHGLTLEKMDKNFVAIFPVDQQRLETHHFFSNVHSGSVSDDRPDILKVKHLFVAAAGDANNSPHFMRYSGLTGAREDILGLKEYTEYVVKNNSDYGIVGRPLLMKRMEGQWERTSQYVISRGVAFLKPLPEAEINKQRQEKMRGILNRATVKAANSSPSFTMTKGDGDTYTMTIGGESKMIFLRDDGSLQMNNEYWSPWDRIGEEFDNFDSIEQIRLEAESDLYLREQQKLRREET